MTKAIPCALTTSLTAESRLAADKGCACYFQRCIKGREPSGRHCIPLVAAGQKGWIFDKVRAQAGEQFDCNRQVAVLRFDLDDIEPALADRFERFAV